MKNSDIEALQNKIEEGLKIAAQKLMETKKQKKQKIAVCIDGKIQIITPV